MGFQAANAVSLLRNSEPTPEKALYEGGRSGLTGYADLGGNVYWIGFWIGFQRLSLGAVEGILDSRRERARMKNFVWRCWGLRADSRICSSRLMTAGY